MATTIYDGTFTGTATTAGGAGTTTGVADTASVGTANAWTDVVGGAYFRDGSGNLTHNSIANYTSYTILTRPSGEACNDHSIECRWVWDGSTAIAIVPILRKNSNNWYWFTLRPYNTGGSANQTSSYKIVSGSLSTSGMLSDLSTGVTWVAGHHYRAVFKAIGFSPTTLSVDVYDLDGGTPATPIYSRSQTDSTTELQVAGTCGFQGWTAGFGTLQTTRVIISNEAVSAATGYSLSGPSTCTVGSASSNFTVTLTPSGGTNAGTTITPSDGGAGGSFSPSTVSLSTGTPSATFTYTAASSGSKTISTTNSGGLSNPTSLSVTALSPATGYSLSGPSTCTVGSASSNFTVTLTPSGGTNSGVTITPSDSSGGGSFTPSTVSLSTGTPSATFTYTAGSTGTKTISTTNSGSLSNPTSLSVTASAPALTMGALSVSSRTATSITVGWSAATGGTGTKTYTLYRYTSAPFTPPGTGTSVGSTTSTSLTDSSPGTGNVYYRVIVTDGASSTSTSVQSADQTALLTRVVLAPIVVGLIGDSITANMGSAGTFIGLIAAQEPTRTVTLGSNQGVAGLTSTDWLPGGSYLPGALSAFTTAGVTHVSIMLGTNDAKTSIATSSGTYSSNIASIAAACVTAGFKVCLNGPLFVVPGSYSQWDEAANVRLAAYRDSLLALTNGTTIFMGDTQLFDAIAASPATYLSDGVHPNSTGNNLIWNRWVAN